MRFHTLSIVFIYILVRVVVKQFTWNLFDCKIYVATYSLSF